MWSKIPNLQGLRAAGNWLRDLAPERQERVRRNYDHGVRRIKRALGQDRELLRTFEAIVDHARLFGRVDGLREGLELYEYGTRIQQKNTAAFLAILNYIARCVGRYKEKQALADAISAEHVCEHLDGEIERTKKPETPYMKIKVRIKPPAEWGCETWKEALEKKSSSVRKLISKAKKEALSNQYCTLMAWKTWCREANLKKRAATGEQSRNDPTLEIGREEKAPA
jgi:hypothetical protein